MFLMRTKWLLALVLVVSETQSSNTQHEAFILSNLQQHRPPSCIRSASLKATNIAEGSVSGSVGLDESRRYLYENYTRKHRVATVDVLPLKVCFEIAFAWPQDLSASNPTPSTTPGRHHHRPTPSARALCTHW